MGSRVLLLVRVLHGPFARALTSDCRLVVVQLGDSYSAGNGARDANGTVNFASVPECYRSPTNWGAQATAALPRTNSGRVAIYVNRACSNATIADLTNPRLLKTRITRKVNGLCNATRALFAPEEYYVERNPSRTSLCVNVLQSQYLGITKEADVVILTSGGNDLGFGTDGYPTVHPQMPSCHEVCLCQSRHV
jgi:lysophospholipase L1-like esterase